MKDKEQKLAKLYVAPKSTPFNSVAGYVPNVPNAIRNLPCSMINCERIPRKTRAVSIIYCQSASAYVGVDDLMEAGIALVSAINILEKHRIQTKLAVEFGNSRTSMNDNSVSEIVFADVKIKDFHERFNLQKICFPIAHPSMFRRIGFKYLETVPDLRCDSFASGYGYPVLSSTTAYRFRSLGKDEFFITYNWIHQNNNSIERIIDELGVI